MILSMDTHSQSIATGHADNMIRLWDPRDQGSVMIKMKLKGHKNWVSSVKWTNDYLLASASYDCSVKLWDIRAPSFPLHSLSDESKLLSCCYQNGLLLSGGEGKKLNLYKL